MDNSDSAPPRRDPEAQPIQAPEPSPEAPERERDNAYPGIRQSIWLLSLCYLLMFAISIPITILDLSLVAHPATLAVTNLTAIGLILALGVGKSRAPLKAVFPLRPVRVSLLVPLSLTALGLVILLSEMGNLLNRVLPMPSQLADFFMNFVGGKRGLWGSILAVVVVAPLTEELLFRGLILRGFLRRYTVRKAVLASGVLFGLFHLNPWQAPGAAAMGILFAWLFVRTGSLLPCLFCHALVNAVPVVLIGVLGLEIPGLSSDFSGSVFQPLWLDTIGLLSAGSGMWLLIRAFGETRTAHPEGGR